MSECRGYEDWLPVAVSHPADKINQIAANPSMIDAYRAGLPGNNKPFPDGSKIVKIHWKPKQSTEAPFPVAGAGHSDRPYNKNLSTMKAPTEADAFSGEGRPLLGSTQSLGYPSRIPKEGFK